MPYISKPNRSAVLALKTVGHMTSREIAAALGISRASVDQIYAKACARGFEPNEKPLKIIEAFIEDKPRSGRPRKMTPTVEEKLLEQVSSFENRNLSGASLAHILSNSLNISISSRTIQYTLKRLGYMKVKPTPKPGLTPEMRAARKRFAMEHKDWTLEDWKKVIWTDETSVMLRYWKGAFRIWRRTEERYDKRCIRRRFKKGSEFMFWAAFSYDKKGPCFCWPPESAAEKRENESELEALNRQYEPRAREEWELNTRMRRLGLRNRPGRQPVWSWNRRNGKLVRDGKGGIDWFRYQKYILRPLLFPFAQECLQDRPDTVVMEDNAPPHAHQYNRNLYHVYDIRTFIWPGNSPDLNPIEPVWRWLKRYIRERYRPKTRKEAIEAFQKAWAEIPQSILQKFVARLTRHIRKVIELDGGNEYREGGVDSDWEDVIG